MIVNVIVQSNFHHSPVVAECCRGRLEGEFENLEQPNSEPAANAK